jgi:hypothetical protein
MRQVVLALAVLIAVVAVAVTAGTGQLDDLGNSVVFLVAIINTPQTKFGTGVFLVDGNTPFLATAEHVARHLSARSLAVIRAKDGTALQIPFSKLIGTAASPAWRYHDAADLAILMLEPEASLIPQLSARFLPVALLRSEQSAPPRHLTLTVVGFPLALGVSGKFSPISRETKPASDLLITKRGDTKRPALFFITQDPSIGGFSGAPVFDTGLPYSSDDAAIVLRGKTLQVVGIIHGTLSDDTGGKLGAVTPAHLLRDLVHKAMGSK